MLILKKGFPEESEILLCTVTKIHYHSVFVSLDEYDTQQGMIHISEISPGRIRNLNDYVQEGKKIVCKVLRINHDRGHIDLSLRRVSQGQKRAKIEFLKQEQKSEKILEFVAKQQENMKTIELFNKIHKVVFDNYFSLHECFQAIVDNQFDIREFGLDDKLSKLLEDTIRLRIKPPKVEIKGELTLLSFESDGLSIVKECLVEVLKKYNLNIFYLGGGKYSFKIESGDFKSAEKILKESTKFMEDFMSKKHSEFSYTREEGKKAKN